MAVSRKQINLRVSEEFLAQLEEIRGLVPREAWMRDALTKALDVEIKARATQRQVEEPGPAAR